MSVPAAGTAFLDPLALYAAWPAWAQEVLRWPGWDAKQLILIAVSPVFVLAIGLEWWWMRRQGRSNQTWLDVLTNVGLGSVYQLFELVVHALLFTAAMHWVYEHRLWNVPFNAWTLLPLFVLQEFCYYWFHRASHRIRWFWSAHVVHHSEERMNLSTALRQSCLYSLTGYWVFFIPLMLIGLTPAQAMTLYAINLFYQFFVHTEAVDKLPRWMEWLFVTPSHHRAHHGRNPRYIDKNYGGVLIVFDRLFGTFVEETEPVDYGIPNQIHSHNLWTLNVHEWSDMARDISQTRSWRDKLGRLWRPPEWTPRGG